MTEDSYFAPVPQRRQRPPAWLVAEGAVPGGLVQVTSDGLTALRLDGDGKTGPKILPRSKVVKKRGGSVAQAAGDLDIHENMLRK